MTAVLICLLAVAGACVWAFVERSRGDKARLRQLEAESIGRLNEGVLEDADKAVRSTRAEAKRLDVLAKSRQETIIDQRRRLNDVSKRDPVLARDLLRGVLETGGGLTPEAARATRGDEGAGPVRPSEDADVDPSHGDVRKHGR